MQPEFLVQPSAANMRGLAFAQQPVVQLFDCLGRLGITIAEDWMVRLNLRRLKPQSELLTELLTGESGNSQFHYVDNRSLAHFSQLEIEKEGRYQLEAVAMARQPDIASIVVSWNVSHYDLTRRSGQPASKPRATSEAFSVNDLQMQSLTTPTVVVKTDITFDGMSAAEFADKKTQVVAALAKVFAVHPTMVIATVKERRRLALGDSVALEVQIYVMKEKAGAMADSVKVVKASPAVLNAEVEAEAMIVVAATVAAPVTLEDQTPPVEVQVLHPHGVLAIELSNDATATPILSTISRLPLVSVQTQTANGSSHRPADVAAPVLECNLAIHSAQGSLEENIINVTAIIGQTRNFVDDSTGRVSFGSPDGDSGRVGINVDGSNVPAQLEQQLLLVAPPGASMVLVVRCLASRPAASLSSVFPLKLAPFQLAQVVAEWRPRAGALPDAMLSSPGFRNRATSPLLPDEISTQIAEYGSFGSYGSGAPDATLPNPGDLQLELSLRQVPESASAPLMDNSTRCELSVEPAERSNDRNLALAVSGKRQALSVDGTVSFDDISLARDPPLSDADITSLRISGRLEDGRHFERLGGITLNLTATCFYATDGSVPAPMSQFKPVLTQVTVANLSARQLDAATHHSISLPKTRLQSLSNDSFRSQMIKVITPAVTVQITRGGVAFVNDESTQCTISTHVMCGSQAAAERAVSTALPFSENWDSGNESWCSSTASSQSVTLLGDTVVSASRGFVEFDLQLYPNSADAGERTWHVLVVNCVNFEPLAPVYALVRVENCGDEYGLQYQADDSNTACKLTDCVCTEIGQYCSLAETNTEQCVDIDQCTKCPDHSTAYSPRYDASELCTADSLDTCSPGHSTICAKRCFCDVGWFEVQSSTDPQAFICLACVSAIDCRAPGTDLARAVAHPGWWQIKEWYNPTGWSKNTEIPTLLKYEKCRESLQCEEAAKCKAGQCGGISPSPVPQEQPKLDHFLVAECLCLGGPNYTWEGEQCHAGHMGPKCGTCKDNWVMGTASPFCQNCKGMGGQVLNRTKGAAYTIALVLFLVLLFKPKLVAVVFLIREYYETQLAMIYLGFILMQQAEMEAEGAKESEEEVKVRERFLKAEMQKKKKAAAQAAPHGKLGAVFASLQPSALLVKSRSSMKNSKAAIKCCCRRKRKTKNGSVVHRLRVGHLCFHRHHGETHKQLTENVLEHNALQEQLTVAQLQIEEQQKRQQERTGKEAAKVSAAKRQIEEQLAAYNSTILQLETKMRDDAAKLLAALEATDDPISDDGSGSDNCGTDGTSEEPPPVASFVELPISPDAEEATGLADDGGSEKKSLTKRGRWHLLWMSLQSGSLRKCRSTAETSKAAKEPEEGEVMVVIKMGDQVVTKGQRDIARAVVNEDIQEARSKIKILVGLSQVLGQCSANFDITWPPAFRELSDNLNFINLSFLKLPSVGCFVKTNFLGEMVLMTVAVGAFIGVVFLYHQVLKLFKLKQAWFYDKSTVISVVVSLLFLVYPSVSNLILRTFDCDKLANGDTYLAVDYSIQCSGKEAKTMKYNITNAFYSPKLEWTYSEFRAYAVVMLLLFPIGIPLLFSCILHSNKDALYDYDKATDTWRPNPEHAKKYGLLYCQYERTYLYWEGCEMVRKLMLTGIIIFIMPGTASQFAVGALIAMIFIVLNAKYQPYQSGDDDLLQLWCQLGIFMNLFSGLLLKVEQGGASEIPEDTLGVVLVICSILPIVCGGYFIVVYSIGPLLKLGYRAWDTRRQYMKEQGEVSGGFAQVMRSNSTNLERFKGAQRCLCFVPISAFRFLHWIGRKLCLVDRHHLFVGCRCCRRRRHHLTPEAQDVLEVASFVAVGADSNATSSHQDVSLDETLAHVAAARAAEAATARAANGGAANGGVVAEEDERQALAGVRRIVI
jgi:hypothetical protein